MPEHPISLDLDRAQQEAIAKLDDPQLQPGRIVARHKDRYSVFVTGGIVHAPAKRPTEAEQNPAVGDFVATEVRDGMALIRDVLPRRSVLSRKTAGSAAVEQILAANVDVVAIVEPLDAGPNLRRIERYLTAAWESGARPVVLLTKSDASQDPDTDLVSVTAIAPGVEVWLTSIVTGDGLSQVESLDEPGVTLVVLGRSGAGKSSLINHLLAAEVMKTNVVRADGKGRHTTTHRELFALPNGGAIIDTPGIRELQLWSGSAAADATFEDIAALASGCRFSDCSHTAEPGCAVLQALTEGELDAGRLESYRKQLREMKALELRLDKRKARAEHRRWGKVAKEAANRSRRR